MKTPTAISTPEGVKNSITTTERKSSSLTKSNSFYRLRPARNIYDAIIIGLNQLPLESSSKVFFIILTLIDLPTARASVDQDLRCAGGLP